MMLAADEVAVNAASSLDVSAGDSAGLLSKDVKLLALDGLEATAGSADLQVSEGIDTFSGGGVSASDAPRLCMDILDRAGLAHLATHKAGALPLLNHQPRKSSSNSNTLFIDCKGQVYDDQYRSLIMGLHCKYSNRMVMDNTYEK